MSDPRALLPAMESAVAIDVAVPEGAPPGLRGHAPPRVDLPPFTAAELRESMSQGAKWLAERSASGRSCLGGMNAACYAFARETGYTKPFPADDAGRRSLIRAVWALHGAVAVAGALADTAGGIGTRLARGSGVGEDSLMLEWRYWVLTRGGRPSVRGLLADAAPAVLLAGLLLAAAWRSRG